MPNAVVEKLLVSVAKMQQDIQWLKRAFWTLVTGGITFNVLLAIATFTYLLNHK